jgi:hypothetical protein
MEGLDCQNYDVASKNARTSRYSEREFRGQFRVSHDNSLIS